MSDMADRNVDRIDSALDEEALRRALRFEPDEHPPRFDAATYQKFDDPAGDGTKAVAESLWHDIRAPLRDAPEGAPQGNRISEQQYDLDDGKGARSVAEIDAELKAGESAIDAIRSCL